MFNKLTLIFLAVFLLAASTANAQKRQQKSLDPAKYNLDTNDEKLKKISIRLKIEGSQAENQPFKVTGGKDVVIQVLASTSDQRTIALGYASRQLSRLQFQLLGANDSIVPYSAAIQERLDQKRKDTERKGDPNAIYRESGPSIFISPNQENVIGQINVTDWYGKLKPGVYKAAVKFGFGDSETENKIESNIVTFEVY